VVTRPRPATVGTPAEGSPSAIGAKGPAAVQPVLLIPGFLCGDGSLWTLAAALRDGGHPVHPSGIACNADCAEAAVVRLLERVATLAERHQRRVALVGHSRGGLFARVVAHRRPDLISGIVALGSPHRDQRRVHPLLWTQALALAALGSLGVPGLLSPTCGAGRCCEPFRRDLAAPPPGTVGRLSIYSKIDGIVDWRACREADGHHTEVASSHYRMPTHAPTLRTVVSALATFDSRPIGAAPDHSVQPSTREGGSQHQRAA
jgi:triacylglycerol lipase